MKNESLFTLKRDAEKVGVTERVLTAQELDEVERVGDLDDAVDLDGANDLVGANHIDAVKDSDETELDAGERNAAERNAARGSVEDLDYAEELDDLDAFEHIFSISTFLDEPTPGSEPRFSIDQLVSETGSDARVQDLEAQLLVLQDRNKTLEERGKKLAQELDIFRQRRLVYWSDRFRNRFDAWHLMHPGFEETKDDTMLFQGDMKGFRLLPSLNLVRLSSLKYELNLGRSGLCAILLAPIIDMPSTVGEICVRITDSKQLVLREVSFPIDKISEEQPCELRFPSLESLSLNRLYVHIFAQSVDVPVRLFELRKYPRFGFAKVQRKLFAGFRFA
ncbi:MAG: hypothetical protein SGJ27_18500 [Candidatus Melainabacteria bacterium]|nr:hypothetical protein [Candidatus Melainabacteria bacterium]